MLNSVAVVRVEATRKAWSRCEISNTASLGTLASRANRLVEGATSLAGVILPPETSRSGDRAIRRGVRAGGAARFTDLVGCISSRLAAGRIAPRPVIGRRRHPRAVAVDVDARCRRSAPRQIDSWLVLQPVGVRRE